MAFDDLQKKALKAKLSHRHVKIRESHGASLAYVEGWHAIAEANRIFGFDSWDRQTVSPQCQWSEVQRGQTVCFYSTKVRITVRAGGTVTIREGIGTGLGRSPHPEVAHETGLKAAETDATKRALATFGNPFGLALYDKEQREVTKPRAATPKAEPQPLCLKLDDTREVALRDEASFVRAVERQSSRLNSVEAVAAFWSANLASLTELRRRCEGRQDDAVAYIVGLLKERLRQVGGVGSKDTLQNRGGSDTPEPLLIAKEKRLRDRDHLAFVAGQPCLVCGRNPSQAHHLKFAQPRAMSMKVSDEFTVPLCNVHHDALHKTGDERAWWARHGIVDPLKFAARLWAASRQARPTADQSIDSPSERDTSPDLLNGPANDARSSASPT